METVMEERVSDFSRHWLEETGQGVAPAGAKRPDPTIDADANVDADADADAGADERAWEALVERVNAARAVF